MLTEPAGPSPGAVRMIARSSCRVSRLATLCDNPYFANNGADDRVTNMVALRSSVREPTVINGVQVNKDNAQALLPPAACVFVAKYVGAPSMEYQY